LGGIIEGHSYNGNNICQFPPLCFLASANNGKSDSSVSIIERSNHSSIKDECCTHIIINSPICCQAIVNKNEKQKHKDTKLHKKQQVSKDKKYLQMLFANDKKHSKLVSNLHENFNDQLSQSDEKLNAATKQYQNLKQDYNACFDDIKIKHRSRL
jgi:hypothetical protein